MICPNIQYFNLLNAFLVIFSKLVLISVAKSSLTNIFFCVCGLSLYFVYVDFLIID